MCMRVCVWRAREREIYFNELAHIILEAGKSKLCRVDQQAGEELMQP